MCIQECVSYNVHTNYTHDLPNLAIRQLAYLQALTDWPAFYIRLVHREHGQLIDTLGKVSENGAMARKADESGRSKQRQSLKGFPHRVVAYLDSDTKRLLERALRATGENTSMFTARAIVERATRALEKD